MAKNYNTSCDSCGTILYGQDRGAFIRKDNIFFNGQAGKNVVDPQTGYSQTVFFTRTNAEQTCFCDAECLNDWMNTQEALYQNRKKAKLMEEVNSGASGQEPVQRDRPAYTAEAPKRVYGSGPPAAAPTRISGVDVPAKRIRYGGEID